METPNAWEDRSRSREASNDYYQKTPLVGPMNGYNDGAVTSMNSWEGVEADQGIKEGYEPDTEAEDEDPKGIKSENSMNGYLTSNNPAYQESKNK